MLTLDLLHRRHAVRSYGAEEISAPSANKLNAEVTFINTHEAGLNFRMCYGSGDPFKGFTRSYGMFRGVNNYLVAAVDPTFPDVWERAGFFGEQLVMLAVSLGLGTCFVSGTYSREAIGVPLEVYEKVAFLVTIGHEEGRASLISRITAGFAHRKQMTPREFFEGSEQEYREARRLVPDLDKGLEAIACAPSALNRRPVRIKLAEFDGEKHICATVPSDADDMKIDLGIAKYNFSAVVKGAWLWGNGAPFYT